MYGFIFNNPIPGLQILRKSVFFAFPAAACRLQAIGVRASSGGFGRPGS